MRARSDQDPLLRARDKSRAKMAEVDRAAEPILQVIQNPFYY